MLGDLQKHGYQVTSDVESADAVIINTCAFIDQAKKESIRCIQDAAQLKVPLVDFDDGVAADVIEHKTADVSALDAAGAKTRNSAEVGARNGHDETGGIGSPPTPDRTPPKIVVTGCLAQRYSAYVEH